MQGLCIGAWTRAETREVNDEVNHPDHYGGDTPYEAIKVIEAWELNFNLGNTTKYICRTDLKGDPISNLKKARFYLDREIATREAAKAALPAWVTQKTRDQLAAAVSNAQYDLAKYDKDHPK